MGIYYPHVGVGTAPEGLHLVGHHRLVRDSRGISRRSFFGLAGWAAFVAEVVADGPLFVDRSGIVDRNFRLKV